MPDTPTWMIYGAYGYTGELIAREAARRGLKPVLAGRNPARIESLAAELGLPARVVDLDDAAQLEAALANIHTVIHCAGPFVHTSPPMVRACLNTGTNYLDITGEIPVFEAIMAQTETAKAAGVSLIPGVGFDVVPTDCLAAQLAAALPDATHLELAFYTQGGSLSGGTVKSSIEHAGGGNKIRQGNEIVVEPVGKVSREIPFSIGVREAMSIPWGDVSTAWHTTNIPNIRVYMGGALGSAKTQRYVRRLMGLLSWSPIKRLAQWIAGQAMSGPTANQRETARVHLWGEVRNAAGEIVTATFQTGEGYQLTMLAGLAAAERVLSGEIPPGSWTPARAFGIDFVQQLPDVTALTLQRTHP